MEVVRLSDSAGRPVLVHDVAPRPEPGQDEVLIRVCAAAVIPTELLWYPTSHTKSGAKRSGAIPGHEFSGVVVATNQKAGSLESGLEVFGMNDWFSDGAMAEYCVAPVSGVAPKPFRLSHAEAASVPISALTAWQGLLDRARVQAGERVLVHGGAGAVGAYAVQLARLHGAHVIATASAEDATFVSELGAEQVIDYRASRFEQCVSDIDVVFDTVGRETLRRSWRVLKPQGRMITIASAGENAADPRSKEAFFIVEPSRKQLTLIANLLDTGELRAVMDSVVPLSRAPEAYAGTLPRRHRGKLVVSFATNEIRRGDYDSKQTRLSHFQELDTSDGNGRTVRFPHPRHTSLPYLHRRAADSLQSPRIERAASLYGARRDSRGRKSF